LTIKPLPHLELIVRWFSCSTRQTTEQLAKLYYEDAINHQVANETVKGKTAIKKMFADEFSVTSMTCIVANIFEDGVWGILEWKDPLGLRGCGFFQIAGGKIKFQRGYWDKLSFLRKHGLPVPGTKYEGRALHTAQGHAFAKLRQAGRTLPAHAHARPNTGSCPAPVCWCEIRDGTILKRELRDNARE
jgi:hypothetical protein